jgi:TPR repeat protein
VGTSAVTAGFALRPTGLDIGAEPITLLTKGESAPLSAIRIGHLGIRRSAGRVAWSSADPRIATVDAEGVVRPIATGRTRVESKDGAYVASREVLVSLPARVALDPEAITLSPDHEEVTVKAAVIDGAGQPWKGEGALTWTSSEASIATVAGGKVRRKGTGQAVIEVALGDLRARLAVASLDRREALERACSKGGQDACVELGHLVEAGGPDPASAARALAFYEAGCAAGALKGCVAAGESHEAGRAGVIDLAKALVAYQKACDGKEAAGCTHVGALYETGGRGVIRAVSKAEPLYRAGCDGGDLAGCAHLGALYELGRGVLRDTPAAADFYKKACDSGRPEACARLANMYWNGSGAIARDLPAGVALYEKSCDGKYAEACTFLALTYRAGRGVAEDKPRSLTFFTKACEAGNKGACALAEKPTSP